MNLGVPQHSTEKNLLIGFLAIIHRLELISRDNILSVSYHARTPHVDVNGICCLKMGNADKLEECSLPVGNCDNSENASFFSFGFCSDNSTAQRQGSLPFPFPSKSSKKITQSLRPVSVEKMQSKD